MQASRPIEITCTLTAWDYAAMARALTRRPWQRSLVTMVLWLFAVWCLLVFSTNLYNPVIMASVIVTSGSTLWIVGGLVVVALFSLGTHWLAWAVVVSLLPANSVCERDHHRRHGR